MMMERISAFIIVWACVGVDGAVDTSLGYGRTFGLDIPKYDKVRKRYLNVFGTNEVEDNLGRDIVLKKIVGIGASPSFIGGAFVGNEENSTLEVYARYTKYKKLVGEDVAELADFCAISCPSHLNAHCNSGLCFCNPGYVMEYGNCVQSDEIFFPNGTTKNIYLVGSFSEYPCDISEINNGNDYCWKKDINTVCVEKESSVYKSICECKQGTKRNSLTEACELFVDVDCSDFTYDSPSDPVLLEIGVSAEKQGTSGNQGKIDEAKIPSLLAFLPNDLTKKQYREAFCRDVDVFALDMEQKRGTFGAGDVINVIFIIIGAFGLIALIGICCACCICCCCYKKCKDCVDGVLNPDPLKGMSDGARATGVALAVMQDAAEDANAEKNADALTHQRMQQQQQQQQYYPQQQQQQQFPPQQQQYPPQHQQYPQQQQLQGYPQQPTGYLPVQT